MMIQPLPIAGKLPVKTLVAKQLPTKSHITHVHVHLYVVRIQKVFCAHNYVLNLRRERETERLIERHGSHINLGREIEREKAHAHTTHSYCGTPAR